MMSDLETAIKLAAEAHRGQVDKGGEPYIFHVMRVAMHWRDPTAQIVGALHDVLEDSSFTEDALYELGFSDRIIEAVTALTRKDGESYMDFIRRVRENNLAALVKIADLIDNSKIDRIPHPTNEDFQRVKKYRKALKLLLA